MLVRLEVPNGDLVAIEVRYHRKKNCYTIYINPRNIGAIQAQSKTVSNYDKALKILIDEITPDINNSQVFLLSSMLSRFQELLLELGVELDDAQRHTSQNLKAKLTTSALTYHLFLSLDIPIWYVIAT